jgi:hypothetical protein
MDNYTDKHEPDARRVREALLLNRRVAGDRLVLDDATLGAALDGSRPLTAGERAALQASPLTARRLRHLALERRAAVVRSRGMAPGAWRGSRGLLRAASSGTLEAIVTDDGWWTLHVVADGGAWRAILQLAAQAPFAAALLAARAPLRVLDGAGRTILAGRLDADGEIEAPWPFAGRPDAHLQAHGARFAVEPATT